MAAASEAAMVLGAGRPRSRCSYPPKMNSLSLMMGPLPLTA